MESEEFSCSICNYKTKRKNNYERHINSEKHLKKTNNLIECTNYKRCNYCNKVFKHSSSLSRHIKYFCKKNKDEDMRELVKLLNLENKNNLCLSTLLDGNIPEEDEEEVDNNIDGFSCNYCLKRYKKKTGLWKHLKNYHHIKVNKKEEEEHLINSKNISRLLKKLQLSIPQVNTIINNNDCINNNNINNINNINNVINKNININLLNHKETDISHLTDKDYIASLNRYNNCIYEIVKRIHFNPKKPENMNIYISNIKQKYIMIYENNGWLLKDRDTEIDNLIDSKELLLEDWLESEQDKYPLLKKKFEHYLNSKEDNEILNQLKEDIKLLMYNNKKLIKK